MADYFRYAAFSVTLAFPIAVKVIGLAGQLEIALTGISSWQLVKFSLCKHAIHICTVMRFVV